MLLCSETPLQPQQTLCSLPKLSLTSLPQRQWDQMVSFPIPSPCTGFLLISALGFFRQEEAFLGPVRIVPARLVHSVLGEQLDGNEGCSQSWGKGAQII